MWSEMSLMWRMEVSCPVLELVAATIKKVWRGSLAGCRAGRGLKKIVFVRRDD
jgi:hypothetical protein